MATRTRAKAPDIKQVMLAKMTNQRTETESDLWEGQGERLTDDEGTVTHKSASVVTLWKPTPAGYVPKQIPVTNMEMCFQNGFLPYCPDCGSQDCGPLPNDCPGRPKKAYRVCPIAQCGKKVYDHQHDTEILPEEGDEARIDDGSYKTSTPELRTKVALDRHLWAFHAEEAASMGVALPPNRRVR